MKTRTKSDISVGHIVQQRPQCNNPGVIENHRHCLYEKFFALTKGKGAWMNSEEISTVDK
jgi:hypothetical protein